MSASLIEQYTQEGSGTRDALSFIMDEETPCDHCEYRQRCAIKRMACSAFAKYVQTGDVTHRSNNDVPSARHYRRVFERKEREDASWA
ncbi:MAG: hypothetical protein ACYDB0_02645 [Acidithiobacillus sp.]